MGEVYLGDLQVLFPNVTHTADSETQWQPGRVSVLGVQVCAQAEATCFQEMLQHELSRFQNGASSDVRIDPDASAHGDSFNHSRAHELRYDDVLGSPQPLHSRTGGAGKRSRSIRRGKSEHRGVQLRSSCAEELIAAALTQSDGTNKRTTKKTSKSPDPKHKLTRQRYAHSGLCTESLGPAPIHFDPSTDCADLLAEWGVSQTGESQAPKGGTENASAQLNSIERMLDDSVAERDNVDHKQEHNAQMQRLQAIEQDWSTINGMRQDFESTKAKLKTLMHRELTPQTHSLPPAPRAPRATPGDHASHTYSPRCDPMDNAAQYAQQQKAQMHGANTELDMAADMAQSCRGMDGVSQTAGTVAVECSKPYSQWHRYEQRLQAREAEAEAAELRSEVETLKQQMKSLDKKKSTETMSASASPAQPETRHRHPLENSTTKQGQGTSAEMDALYSALEETRSTMLHTLRRVQWCPGATPAVSKLEERLHSQCLHGAPVNTHCSTANSTDPVQLSHGMLAQARELLETLVEHVESAHVGKSGKHELALPSDVHALQDHLADMTREYSQIRDNLAAERGMRRDAEKALSTAAADAAAANTAPVQGLLDALHAARAEATATKNSNRELRQQRAALDRSGGGDAATVRRSQSLSPQVRLGAAGSSTGGGVGAAEAEIAARDEALADAVQEAAELRRQLRAASAAQGEVECLEREIAGLTRDVDVGAVAKRDVTRLEREVGDLKWQLERATEDQEEVQKLREELEASRSGSSDDVQGRCGNGERPEDLRERLNVAEMALERELAEKNRLEKDVERWKGTDGKELERLRNEMAALEKVKEESILDLRRLERRHADTAQQLEDSKQALETERLARKHAEQHIGQTSEPHTKQSDPSHRGSPAEREASLWGGLGPARSGRHVDGEASLSVSVSIDGGAVSVEGAERQVHHVERELAHAKARVRELRSREHSLQHSTSGGRAGASSEWGALLESPDAGRNVLLEGSRREASDGAGGDSASSSAALRDLESRVTRLEKERAAATARLDLARSLQGQSRREHSAQHAHSMRSSDMHGADGAAAPHGWNGAGGPLDAFVRAGDVSGAGASEARDSDSGVVWDLAGSLSRLEEEVAMVLGNQGEGGGSAGDDVQQRLRRLAESVHKRLMSASARVRDAKSAAAVSDARASALAARLRLAGMSDEVAGLPLLGQEGSTGNAMSDGAPQSVEQLQAELVDARREVSQLQAALQDALQRVEAQAAELLTLRGAGLTGAVGPTSPVTSAGSTPLISAAWAPGSAGAVGAHSLRSVSAEPAVLNSAGEQMLTGSAGASRSESSLRSGATVAGILAPEGSGNLLDSAQRLGSLSYSIPGWPSEPGLHTHSSKGAVEVHMQNASLQLKPVAGPDVDSGGGDSARGAQTHGGLLENLLDVSNEISHGRSSSPGCAAGQGKQTFMGVDLSDIDGSSVGAQEGAQPSTRQSSPIRHRLPTWGDKVTSEYAGQEGSGSLRGDFSPRRSGEGAAWDSAQAANASTGGADRLNPLLDSRTDASSRSGPSNVQDQQLHSMLSESIHIRGKGSAELQKNKDPFETHTHPAHGGNSHGEEESSRTAEEASISHMASRDGQDHPSGLQAGAPSIAHRSAVDTLGSSAGAVGHASAEQGALHNSTSNEAVLRQQQLHSDSTAGQSSVGDGGADSRQGRAGQSADGLSNRGDMMQSSSMERLMHHADGRSSAHGSSLRPGRDARLDLSAFGPDASSGAADNADADEDPITAMTRRSLRKLEQHEAEDQRRRSMSPLRARDRSSTKSNLSMPGGSNAIAPHASAPHGALSARSLSPSASPPPPFQVPAARATSPVLSAFDLSPPPQHTSPESSRTGDWVAVSSRYTHVGDLRLSGAGDMHDGTHGLGGAHDNAQHRSQQRSRSPVLRDVTDDIRANSQVPALPAFNMHDNASHSSPGAAPRHDTSGAMHAAHARGDGSISASQLRPISVRLPVPPNTTAHTGGAAEGDERNSKSASSTENPLEKLRQRLEAWRSAPIPAAGRDNGTPMSPPQFPPARTTSCGGSWSASEQLGRPLTGRGSTTGAGPSGLGFSQSHRGPFSGVPGDDVFGNGTRAASGNLPEASADSSSGDGAISRAPGDTERSEEHRKILEGFGTPLSGWHASQASVPCPEDEGETQGRTTEDCTKMWTKIPELLTKYGGPGRMVGHAEVFSDDGEPEERDAPALRPGAHSPTAGIRHMTAAVMQLEDARVAASAAAAAAGGAAAPGGGATTNQTARMSMSMPGGGIFGTTWMDSEAEEGHSIGGAWASMGGFESDVWARARKSTPTADLARRLAEVRAGSRR